MFLSKDHKASSLERREMRGVEILAHIPYKICSFPITSVNFKMTLAAERITAGLMWDSRERHRSTTTSANFASLISIWLKTSSIPTWPQSLLSGNPPKIFSTNSTDGWIYFSPDSFSISERERSVLKRTTVFLLFTKFSLRISRSPFFFTNSGFCRKILATVTTAVFYT